MKTHLQLKTKPSVRQSQRFLKICIASSIVVTILATIIVVYINISAPENVMANENVKPHRLNNNNIGEVQILKVDRLPGNINSQYIELNPIVTSDGSTIYFGRKKHPENVGGEKDLEDIWVSHYNAITDSWSVPENLVELNNEGPNFICAIAYKDDNKFILLGNVYGRNDKMTNGLSYSYLVDDTWSKPEKMKIKDFYTLSEKVDYTMSKDGNVIVMAIYRGDTYGDRDLYVMFNEGEDRWSSPENMGNVINSNLEDATPFISENSEYLYFSSRGHAGYGGSDIFVSKRLDDTWTNWSTPQNLGQKINTRYDEEYFHLPSTGRFAYFTRGENEIDMDIFRIEIDLLKDEEEYVFND